MIVEPASAATVRVERDVFEDIRDDIHTSLIDYQAGLGERNRVVVRQHDGIVLISDRGARLRAGRRCQSLGRHRARCRLDADLDPYFSARLGDRADRFQERSPADFSYDVLGGPGPDRLLGGPGNDVLSGENGNDVVRGGGVYDVLRDGPGRDRVDGGAGGDLLLSNDRDAVADDRFAGGAGRDELSYKDREGSVVGRLGRTVGERGEHDRMTGVEQLTGGRGDDVLRGTSGADGLSGRGGADRLYGYGGADHLDTGISRGSRVFAGSGNDRITANGGVRIACGPGSDRVRLNETAPLLRPDCERVGDAYDKALFPAQPLRVTRRGVELELPCADEAHPRVRRVRLLVGGNVRAQGARGVGKGACRVGLRLTQPLRRPVVARLRYFGEPNWAFVLRP